MLVHDTHGHGEEDQTGCSGTLQTLAEDASHGGYIAGGISVTYTDKGANGQPALTTTAQTVIQAKRHEGELMTERSGTSTATPTSAARRATPAASTRATGSPSTARRTSRT